MLQNIIAEYYNPLLNIAYKNVKEIWLLNNPPVCLTPAIHRGELTYRVPQTGKRISYRQIKKGLIKQIVVVPVPWQILPF